jgi:hypothetical protein
MHVHRLGNTDIICISIENCCLTRELLWSTARSIRDIIGEYVRDGGLLLPRSISEDVIILNIFTAVVAAFYIHLLRSVSQVSRDGFGQ